MEEIESIAQCPPSLRFPRRWGNHSDNAEPPGLSQKVSVVYSDIATRQELNALSQKNESKFSEADDAAKRLRDFFCFAQQ